MNKMQGLILEVTSPRDGAVLAKSPITVTGIVSVGVAKVVVSTIEIRTVIYGTFSTQIDLSVGENIIPIAAIFGRLCAEGSLRVTYSPVL